MASDSTTQARWPVLRERAPFVETGARPARRKPPRSVWLLTGLAFLCGGLVSAAAFSIGWRHQAQRDTAARSALAAETARASRLSASLAAARRDATRQRLAAAQASAAERALARAAATVGSAAVSSNGSASSVAAGAGALDASATRVASELKTLDTYLTTTPTGQLDPGYIATQTTYLTQQLTRLQGNAGILGRSVTALQAALRKLERDARTLKPR